MVVWACGQMDILCMSAPCINYSVSKMHCSQVSSLKSCLARVSHTHSLVPFWQPFFISRLAVKDRAHLNGWSMPHSPRWYRDNLWLLDSGNGYFGYVDFESGKFVRVCFCPGYLRGLTFVGDYAVIGSSLPRDNKTFQGLGLDDELKQRDASPRCDLFVVDLRTGDVPHWVRIEGVVNELYDVVSLPGVHRPMAIGFQSDEIRRMITVGPQVPV